MYELLSGKLRKPYIEQIEFSSEFELLYVPYVGFRFSRNH